MDFLAPRPQRETLILPETFYRLLHNALDGTAKPISFIYSTGSVFEEPLHFPHKSNNYNVNSTTQTSLNLHSTTVSIFF